MALAFHLPTVVLPSSSFCPVIEIQVSPLLSQWSYSQVFIPARMPSFSSLLKRSRTKREAEQPPETTKTRDNTARDDVTRDNIANVDNSRKDRASRRLSTRGDFFRSFLSRTRSAASPRAEADGDIKTKVCNPSCGWVIQL